MPFDLLEPVDQEIVELVHSLSLQHIGAKVALHTEDFTPDLDITKIALLGIPENRGAEFQEKDIDLKLFRREFYKLYAGNWDCKIADLGSVRLGETLSDTYFALKEVASALLKKNITLIVIGGSQDLTYPLYRAYDNLDKMVNLVSVDSKFDFGTSNLPMSMDSYLTKIVMEQPSNLHNYSNLGFQTYFTSQEEIDLMDKMFFESYRLGEISTDTSITEPVLRDADLVSVDLTSIQSAYTGNFYKFVPNGFTGKEICAVSRYAGISDRVSIFGIFNQEGDLRSEAVLQAQMVWYFIEGYTHRYNEYPIKDLNNHTKYIVTFEDDEDMVFYKSEFSQRWWIQVPINLNAKNKLNKFTLLPCRESEYQEAIRGNYPERWWKEQKKVYSMQ